LFCSNFFQKLKFGAGNPHLNEFRGNVKILSIRKIYIYCR